MQQGEKCIENRKTEHEKFGGDRTNRVAQWMQGVTPPLGSDMQGISQAINRGAAQIHEASGVNVITELGVNAATLDYVAQQAQVPRMRDTSIERQNTNVDTITGVVGTSV